MNIITKNFAFTAIFIDNVNIISTSKKQFVWEISAAL